MKPAVVILSGCGAPAIAAANLYLARLSPHFCVHIVEERNLTASKVVSVIKRRWRKQGLLAVLDLLALRLFLALRRSTVPERCYVPELLCEDINTQPVLDLLKRVRPVWVLTNACSIVHENILTIVKAPMLNVHNGVTPRYRGTGNIWAVREDNPALIGVTVHRLDRGIDTGSRISVSRLDVLDPRCSTLEGMDIAAFEAGAEMVCDFILESRSSIAGKYADLADGYYSFPGLSDWLVARRVLARWRSGGTKGEEAWRSSFAYYAADESKDSYQRMHWERSESVVSRDAQVVGLLDEHLTPSARLIDVGGGDGRLSERLPSLRAYICADYTRTFLCKLTKRNSFPTWAVQCDARSLPFEKGSVDAAVAIGLLQHISESMRVADQIRAVVRPGGLILINTLRQFSAAELCAILAASMFTPARRELAMAIWRRDYFSGLLIDGTLVARRYSLRELLDLFRVSRRDSEVRYDGVAGTALFAREITLLLRCPK